MKKEQLKNNSHSTPFNSRLSGVFTAIVTPFLEDSSGIDYASVDSLLSLQLDSGVKGLVIAGSTGEAATLNDVEYGALIRYITDRTEAKLTCIAGVNSSSTSKAVDLAMRASDCGAEALLVVTPPYNKPTQAGIIKHFEAISAATQKPIMAYNVPGRAVSSLLPKTAKSLFESGVICSLKESSGSVDNTMEFMAMIPGLPVFSGDDSLSLAMIAHGAAGIVSVASNVVPSAVARLCDSARAGDFETARKEHFKLLPLFRAMFLESNPIPVKAALKIRSVIKSSSLRLPLTDATEETLSKLLNLL